MCMLFKYILIFYFILSLTISKVIAQDFSNSINKQDVIQRDWKYVGWANVLSLSRFCGSNHGYKMEVLAIRIKNFKLALTNQFSKTLNFGGTDKEGNKNSIDYTLPFGFYIPIYYKNIFSFGFNSDLYLFSSDSEASKLMELSFLFDLPFVSFSSGYRFKISNGSTKYLKNYNQLYHFDGFFVGATFGLMAPTNKDITSFNLNSQDIDKIKYFANNVLPVGITTEITTTNGYIIISSNLLDDFRVDKSDAYNIRLKLLELAKTRSATLIRSIITGFKLPPSRGIIVQTTYNVLNRYMVVYSVTCDMKKLNKFNLQNISNNNIMSLWQVGKNVILSISF